MFAAIAIVLLSGLALTVLGVILLERRAESDDFIDRSRRRRRDAEINALEGPHS